MLSELSDNKWDQVKMHKKRYTPKHTKLKDSQGRQVHDRLRATTFADYSEQKHWATEQDIIKYIFEEPIWPTNTVETSEITTKELDETIKTLKNNKAPGPDDVPAELFKWLDEQSRKIISEIINECWRTETLIKDITMRDWQPYTKKEELTYRRTTDQSLY